MNFYNIGIELNKQNKMVLMFLSINGKKMFEVELHKTSTITNFHDVAKEIHRIFDPSAKAEGAVIADGYIISHNYEVEPFLNQKVVYEDKNSVALQRN